MEEVARKRTDVRSPESSLRTSDGRYRTLFESMDEGFCIIEMLFDEEGRAADYRFLEANPAFVQQSGLSHDVIGRTMREVVPDLDPKWFKFYGDVATTGVSRRVAEPVDEMGRWWDIHAFRFGGPDSREVAVLFNDITERKRREANIAFLNEVSQDLARLSYVEEAMAALGQKIGAYFRGSCVAFSELDEEEEVITVHHDLHRPECSSLRGAYRIRDFHTLDFRPASRADGTYVVSDTSTDPRTDAAAMAALGIGSFVSVPLLPEGRWRFQLTVFDDAPRVWREDEIQLMGELTTRIWTRLEHARAEAALRLSEERFRTLFESIDEGFCVIEVLYDDAGKADDYRFLEVNPAFEKHTGLAGVVGKTIRQFVPDHDEHWFEAYGRVIETREPMRFVNQGEALGGRWWDVYAFPLGEPESRRVAVLFSDISVRVRAEKEQREAARRKDEFLATLAHELRNPLAPLRNGLQIMKLARGDAEVVEQARAMMERQIGQMVHLIDDLMDISRVSRGQIELRKARVKLDEVVSQAVETSRPLLEEGGHRFELEVEDFSLYVDADTTRLAQVFSNLLNNAAKYTERGGHIRFSVRRRGGDAVVSVEDDGMGIPPEMLQSIFDIFMQVDQGREKAQGGLGIGLSLVKNLVEMHGGSVEAKSEGRGRGSEFVVTLPLVEAAALP